LAASLPHGQCDAEIDHERVTTLEQDVLRLDVRVNDDDGMNVGHGWTMR
jgi:hypothetical protein